MTEPGLAVLLGNNVAHSLSPAIHNAASGALGLDLTYAACHVEPDRLADAVGGLWALGAVGANVTIPHKRAVLELVDSASDTARTLGAANTLVRGADGWHADNTDVEGFLAPLDPHRQSLTGAPAVVLGAGGAARAVVFGLKSLGVASVAVVARRLEQAQALADDLGANEALGFEHAGPRIQEASVVVNATPVGLNGLDSPWTSAEDFHAEQIVYDLLYHPAQTPLMRAASGRGATVIGGLPMLVAQAAGSFRQWTGRDMCLDVATQAALAHLAR